MNPFDLALGIAIGYVAIGLFVFFLEFAFDGKMFEIIYWDMRELDAWIGIVLLFLACVGAWPMIIGFELINKRR